MKKTMFKVFASCIVVVCLTSSVSSRVTPPVQESIAVTIDENPIIEEHLNKQHEQHENLVELNDVDLKPYDFKLIANEELWKLAITADKPMVSPGFHRQRRTFDPELEERLRKEVENDNSTLSVPFESNDAVPVIPPNSNDLEKSQEQEKEHSYELPEPQNSSEKDNPQESNESTGPQESNESTGPQKSNESTGPQKSNESTGPQKSNESTGTQESYESNDVEESEENTDDSSSLDNDNNNKNRLGPSPPLLKTQF